MHRCIAYRRLQLRLHLYLEESYEQLFRYTKMATTFMPGAFKCHDNLSTLHRKYFSY